MRPSNRRGCTPISSRSSPSSSRRKRKRSRGAGSRRAGRSAVTRPGPAEETRLESSVQGGRQLGCPPDADSDRGQQLVAADRLASAGHHRLVQWRDVRNQRITARQHDRGLRQCWRIIFASHTPRPRQVQIADRHRRPIARETCRRRRNAATRAPPCNLVHQDSRPTSRTPGSSSTMSTVRLAIARVFMGISSGQEDRTVTDWEAKSGTSMYEPGDSVQR